MNKFKKIVAVLLSLSSILSFSACNNKKSDNSSETKNSANKTSSISETQKNSDKNKATADISGQTVYYMGISDINATRSTALDLFESQYGAKIEYIPTTDATKFDDLSKRILGGQPVDMFSYDSNAVPYGVNQSLYEPLDKYLDLTDTIWDGVRDYSNSMVYNGGHYVIPYNISPTAVLQYSRTVIKQNNMEDPYELFKQDKWTWSKFTEMMTNFSSLGSSYYGICGWWQELVVPSSGSSYVKYDGKKLINNINDAQIEKAQTLLGQVRQSKLFLDNGVWYSYLPIDHEELFFSLGPWSVKQSMQQNPDSDIFFVPFPKADGAQYYNTPVTADAYMLVKNSDKGDAVAAYITCERKALADEKYTALAKEQSVNAKEFTAEQYDFLHTWFTPASKIKASYDYAYGMGNAMYSTSQNKANSVGIVNNLNAAILNGEANSWEELRNSSSPLIDQQIASAVKK